MPVATKLHGIGRAALPAVVCGIRRMGFTDFTLFHFELAGG